MAENSIKNEAKQKSVVIYVDDEPKNLTLFEIRFKENNWDIHCFDSAITALKKIKELHPSVIVSDQRMPHMSGLEFLEVCSQIVPDAIRMIVTGQTDEEIIIELVRRAKIFDYIVKPWQAADLQNRIQKGIDFHQAVLGQQRALQELKEKNDELERKNKALEESKAREEALIEELAGWAPWPITQALKKGNLKFPFQKDIFCLVFDIVDSYRLADVTVDGRTVRALIMNLFRELVIRHGGINESQGGDAAYAHFGAFESIGDNSEAALSAAREFRVRLRHFSQLHKIQVECGIALNFVPNAVVEQNIIRVFLPDEKIRIERSIATQSNQIDLVHRMEKFCHVLPGSNILATKEFVEKLTSKENPFISVGSTKVKGQVKPVDLYLIASDFVTEDELENFKALLSGKEAKSKKTPTVA